MAGASEQDAVSGQSTTGHQWDGIRELNTPIPKWWMYVFYVTILWAVAYWIVMPAWPVGNGFTTGALGYSSRADVEAALAAAREDHADQLRAMAATPVEDIAADDDLRQYAIAGGEALFKENCAPCHNSGGAGAVGFPALVDDEWIWGGSLEDIMTTVTDGIRWESSENTRVSDMPAFGEYMEPGQIAAMATYVKAMSEGRTPAGEGQDLFIANCAMCHSSDGESPVSDGNPMMGAPALDNNIWLYAGPGGEMTVDMIKAQIAKPRHGVMPAWNGRLKEGDIKMVTIYVHSLGGGQ